MTKNLITTIQVNLCCLIPTSLQNSPELLLLKLGECTIRLQILTKIGTNNRLWMPFKCAKFQSD